MGKLLEVSADVAQADWLRDKRGTFEFTVSSLVSADFEANARILHRIDDGANGRLRWQEFARAHGLKCKPGLLFDELSAAAGVANPPQAPSGGLPEGDLSALVPILQRYTARPQHCWVAIWDGYGDASIDAEQPRFHLPMREYVLFAGAVDAVLDVAPWAVPGSIFAAEPPSLMWSDDHTWVVASDVDLDSTYVGGSSELIEEVLAADEIEALLAQPGDPL